MITKFFLGIAVVAFTSFCGYVFAKKYRIRKLFFREWTIFNERFLTEISYYKRPLGEFVSKHSYKGEFGVLLEVYFQSLPQNNEEFMKILQSSDYGFLSAEEKTVVSDYFNMLGKGDSISQKSYFSAVKETLGKFQAESDATYKKYGDLYIKLGFLCGLFLLILMI